MSSLSQLHLLPALVAAWFTIPLSNHINLVYTGLAIIFACFLGYMFLYTRKRRR